MRSRHVLQRTGYLKQLEADGTPEAEARLENLRELVSAAEDFSVESADPDSEPRTATELFLDQVALVSDVDGWDRRAERVSLMTVHSAKGLEFPFVYVVGLEEGIFPHAASSRDAAGLEEERRLFYVAMTRAMERLTLACARERRRYGTRTFGVPSRFLREIPAELIEGSLPRDQRGAPVGEPSLDYEHAQTEYDDGGAEIPKGMRVRHAVFGIGTVLEVSGTRAGAEAQGPLRPRRREDAAAALREPGARVTSIFEAARHGRALAHALDAFAVVPLLRTGLRLGLFEALRTPQSAAALAERLGLAPIWSSAWARNLHAQGWLQKKGDAYRLAPATSLARSTRRRRLAARAARSRGRHDGRTPRRAARPDEGRRAAGVRERRRGAAHGGDHAARRAARAARARVDPRRAPSAARARHRLRSRRLPGGSADALSRRDGPRHRDRARRSRRRRGAASQEADVTRRAEVLVGDFRTMELPRGTFDLILLNHNLHYFAPARARRAAAPREEPARRERRDRRADAGADRGHPAVAASVCRPAPRSSICCCARTRNLHGLPERGRGAPGAPRRRLRATGEVAVVPGGAVRFVWGSAARVADAKDGA